MWIIHWILTVLALALLFGYLKWWGEPKAVASINNSVLIMMVMLCFIPLMNIVVIMLASIDLCRCVFNRYSWFNKSVYSMFRRDE